jgi:hypothetical protein
LVALQLVRLPGCQVSTITTSFVSVVSFDRDVRCFLCQDFHWPKQEEEGQQNDEEDESGLHTRLPRVEVGFRRIDPDYMFAHQKLFVCDAAASGNVLLIGFL